MRLDRVIGKGLDWGRRRVRDALAAGEVRVGGAVVRDGALQVGRFERVEVGDVLVQARRGRYVVLHKPAGVVSATVDDEHPTVVGLLEVPWAGELHLAGRLDRSTTGLVVLTNDSAFSEALTQPESKVAKVYVVETDAGIPEEAVAAFEAGLWFAKEQVRTQPAGVELLGVRRCRLTIFEGKHHQVKRMFARFGIKVVGLHRESVGPLGLDGLEPGAWRELGEGEVREVLELVGGRRGE